MSLTLYAFVGMIMLIGIVKKNAIMMIDFALNRQRADASMPPEQAIYEAAIIRFRPIMMTTMAALMGTLPIALRQRRGRGIAPAAGPVRGGRPAAVAAADALHHAGDLYLSRPLQHQDAAPQGAAAPAPASRRLSESRDRP